MLYAISAHFSIEGEALVGMTKEEIKAKALELGDVITEDFAQAVIDVAKSYKEEEPQEHQKPHRKAEK